MRQSRRPWNNFAHFPCEDGPSGPALLALGNGTLFCPLVSGSHLSCVVSRLMSTGIGFLWESTSGYVSVFSTWLGRQWIHALPSVPVTRGRRFFRPCAQQGREESCPKGHGSHNLVHPYTWQDRWQKHHHHLTSPPPPLRPTTFELKFWKKAYPHVLRSCWLPLLSCW